MEELLKAIANWGFPMVVSVCLLVRIEAKLDSLEQAIKPTFRRYSIMY